MSVTFLISKGKLNYNFINKAFKTNKIFKRILLGKK